MIINTGCRTDIPAFYSKWLMNCTISFLDLYEKVKRNAPDIRLPNKEEQVELAKKLKKVKSSCFFDFFYI